MTLVQTRADKFIKTDARLQPTAAEERILRDTAFVLAMTRRVRKAILLDESENATQKPVEKASARGHNFPLGILD